MSDPETDVAALDGALPIALLPVRIETRFVIDSTSKLLVRIYPDEIVADLHDARLTAAEVAAGRAYWTLAWNPADELAAWTALVQQHPIRAAWIVQQLRPTTLTPPPLLFPSPPVRPDGLAAATATAL